MSGWCSAPGAGFAGATCFGGEVRKGGKAPLPSSLAGRLPLAASELPGGVQHVVVDVQGGSHASQPRAPAAARSIRSLAPAWIQEKKLAITQRTPIRV